MNKIGFEMSPEVGHFHLSLAASLFSVQFQREFVQKSFDQSTKKLQTMKTRSTLVQLSDWLSKNKLEAIYRA